MICPRSPSVDSDPRIGTSIAGPASDGKDDPTGGERRAIGTPTIGPRGPSALPSFIRSDTEGLSYPRDLYRRVVLFITEYISTRARTHAGNLPRDMYIVARSHLAYEICTGQWVSLCHCMNLASEGARYLGKPFYRRTPVHPAYVRGLYGP